MRKTVVSAFLGGAIVGAAIALLVAPASGKETRRKIGDGFERGRDKFVDAMDYVKDEYFEKKEELMDAIDNAKSKYRNKKGAVAEAVKEAKKEYKEVGEKLYEAIENA